MSKFQLPINEIKRAAGTIVLSAAVAAAYIAVMTGGELNPSARASVAVEAGKLNLPERPVGGRRWRSSNAEQSLPTFKFYGERDHWGRNRAALEGAMTLFQMDGTFSSREIAGGTIHVTLNQDYLAPYLATPFPGGEQPAAFAFESGVGHPFVVAQVLMRAFAAEQLAEK